MHEYQRSEKMKTRTATLLSAAGLAVLAAPALAGSIVLDMQGGAVEIQSGPMLGLFDGVAPHTYTNPQLIATHEALHADGISTENVVTFVLADTADGLGFLVLMDDKTADGDNPENTYLGMSTSAPSSTDYYVNDMNTPHDDDVNVSDPFGVTTTVNATFGWMTGQGGDAFAWTNLQEGDASTFNFSQIDDNRSLAGATSFQFVTFTGNGWEVIETANWTDDNQFAFSFVVGVVPLPAPVFLGLAGLAGVIIARRRRIA
jgi:hypothetical protein